MRQHKQGSLGEARALLWPLPDYTAPLPPEERLFPGNDASVGLNFPPGQWANGSRAGASLTRWTQVWRRLYLFFLLISIRAEYLAVRGRLECAQALFPPTVPTPAGEWASAQQVVARSPWGELWGPEWKWEDIMH